MSGSRSIGRMAIGGALGLVLTIAATQAWSATAAPGDVDATFVPVTPCRLFDMRPDAAPADGKKTPLGPGAANVYTQQVTGTVGQCVGIPTGAVAVSMNVTITNPTATSFLTVFPADQALPNASNLNWVAGGSPTPNKVDVKLSPDGKIKLFNETGTVNVIADIVGYYSRGSLVELTTRLAAVEGAVGALNTKVSSLETKLTALDTKVNALDTAQPVVAYSALSTVVALPLGTFVGSELSASEQLSVLITAPTAGKVAVVAHATARGGGAESRMVCQVTNNTAATSINVNEVLGIASPASSPSQPTLGTNRVFDVVAGPNSFDLMCTATGTSANEIHYRSMTATFTPSP